MAAAVIIDAEGPTALTLARLAANLGVAPPSLYKHVASLEDLIVRVATLSICRLTDVLTAAVLGHSGRQALLAFAKAYRCFAVEHAGPYSLIQAAADPGSTAQQAEIERALGVLGSTIRGYDVPDNLSVHALRLVRAGLHGFVDIETRGGFQMLNSIDESFLLLVDVLDASLKHLAKRTPA